MTTGEQGRYAESGAAIVWAVALGAVWLLAGAALVSPTWLIILALRGVGAVAMLGAGVWAVVACLRRADRR